MASRAELCGCTMGFDVFNNYEIQRCDSCARLESDDDAVAAVKELFRIMVAFESTHGQRMTVSDMLDEIARRLA